MAPNSRSPDKAPLRLWVPAEMKAELLAAAAAEGVTPSAAVIQAVEAWLRKRRSGPPLREE